MGSFYFPHRELQNRIMGTFIICTFFDKNIYSFFKYNDRIGFVFLTKYKDFIANVHQVPILAVTVVSTDSFIAKVYSANQCD